MRDMTEWNTPFDRMGKHTRADFQLLVGMKLRKAERYVATKGFVLRRYGRGTKRYPTTMDHHSSRINVVTRRWSSRIMYVDGIY